MLDVEIKNEASVRPITRKLAVGESVILQVPFGGALYTDSLGPCFGLLGYDPSKQTLFGTHFIPSDQPDLQIQEFQNELLKREISIDHSALAGGHFPPMPDYPGSTEDHLRSLARLDRLKIEERYIDLTPSPLYRADFLGVFYYAGEYRFKYTGGYVRPKRY